MSVVFQEYNGTLIGIGERGRRWRVAHSSTGWRLEYRDPGELTATYVGTHPSREAAVARASGQAQH
jgi:hypothetical protein